MYVCMYVYGPIHLGLYHNDGILYIPNNDGSKCSRIQKYLKSL